MTVGPGSAPRSDDPERRRVQSIVATLTILGGVSWALLLVMMFLVTSACGCSRPQEVKMIDVACAAADAFGGVRCTIRSADAGVEFVELSVGLFDPAGNWLGAWRSPIDFGNASQLPVIPPNPPLDGSSSDEDNGDGRSGVGDVIDLRPISGESLSKLTVKLSGAGAYGPATLT
jgi:hypothetical protein